MHNDTMEKIYYEKQGRKYVPVRTYVSEFMDSYPKGAHVVVCHPGGTSRRYNIDPDFAALIAAGMYSTDVMCAAIHKASKMCGPADTLTPEQREAWKAFEVAMGDDIYSISRPASSRVADAGIAALIKEVDKMLDIPSVRKAYDNFLLIYKLTKDEQKG